LFLAALAWKLMKRGNDHLAGAALACLTTKPQLAAALVLVLLIWSARQRRWGVLLGFAATLAALALLGAWIVPAWPIEMLRAAGLPRRPARRSWSPCWSCPLLTWASSYSSGSVIPARSASSRSGPSSGSPCW